MLTRFGTVIQTVGIKNRKPRAENNLAAACHSNSSLSFEKRRQRKSHNTLSLSKRHF
jgi:hypothetical protein